MNVHRTLFLKILLFLSPLYFLGISAAEKILATVPNVNVLLNEELFLEVVEPEEIGYTFKLRLAKNFGMPFQKFTKIEMTVGQPYHGCSSLSNAGSVQNTVALIERGQCSFVTKTLNAQAAGAVAVVIADNDHSNDQLYIDMIDDNTQRAVHIPAAFLLGKDGYMIKNTLDSLGMNYAVINIPVNVTGVKTHLINQPPWSLW